MDKPSRYQTLIGALGLTQKELKSVQAFCPQGATVMDTDCGTDLIASNTFIIIFRPRKMTDKELRGLCAYYSEVGKAAVPAYAIMDEGGELYGEAAKIITQYPSFVLLTEKIKYHIISAWRLSLKVQTFSASVAKTIKILSLIRRKPGITTQKLAEELEMTPRSVQRYIETLRVAGEWLEYDRVKHGWILAAGKSILWGDFA